MLKSVDLDVGGNSKIVPFIPFGFFLPMVYSGMASLRKSLTVILGFLLVMELLQFFTRLGSFDVDNIILNVTGGFLGYLIYSLRKRGSGLWKSKK